MAGRATTWTPERVEQARALLAQLGSVAAVAARLGRSEAAVRSMFHDKGIDVQNPGPASPAAAPVALPPAPAEDLDWKGARPTSSAAGIERRIVIGDVHFPAHNKLALACVYDLIRALQPHRVIQIGDLLNSAAFSHHGAHSPKPERYDLTLMAGRAFIRSVKKAAPSTKLTLIRGNHDDWASRYEAENPGLEGSFDFETRLGIRAEPDDDRPPPFEDVQVVRHAESDPLILGPVAYAHGNGGGMHFAKRYAENNAPRTGVKVMRVGHHHTIQVYSHRNGCEVWGVGWIGDERHSAFHYAPPPRGWWVGVIVEDIVGELVTTTPVPIINGRALFAGRIVQAAA